MVKIKINKKTHEVIFKCKTRKEMIWVLETYKKGNEKIAEEARESIKNE